MDIFVKCYVCGMIDCDHYVLFSGNNTHHKVIDINENILS